ncbi:type II toxin-antitoxin system HicB family antitoxin [Azospirillum sp. B4]|uniref:type II toxin-antitoxin system HicB family antitoxin n=1 Tax=Azospirillum sp. B4 TaxID=95605 RepID=UPI00034D2E33|nr:type II toxin-antitoxin system HicB family antitoxin [Azospirillum sp. B4]
MATYIALIHKDAESDYGVSFPDLPGCVTAGSTMDEALDMAAEALALHLRGMREDNEAIPEPSGLESIRALADSSAVVAAIRARNESVKTTRINISIPEDVLMEVDAYAEAHGYSRSGLLVLGAKRLMTAA